MKRIAIVAFSFGLRGLGEPGTTNKKLSNIVEKLKRENPLTMIVSQWETAMCLSQKAHYVVEKHRTPGKYLDSEEVAEQAIEFLECIAPKNEWKIIVVAIPFLHIQKCVKLFPGFEVSAAKTGWIPFDRKSIQWWTRDPIRLVIYGVLQKLLGYKGPATEKLLQKLGNKTNTTLSTIELIVLLSVYFLVGLLMGIVLMISFN